MSQPTYVVTTESAVTIVTSPDDAVVTTPANVEGPKGDKGDTGADGADGPNLISDATALGTLTDATAPAFLLVGAAAGDAARKLTPSGWGLSNLLVSIPAGRVPYSDVGGTPTSGANLTFVTGTGTLSATQFVGGGAGLTGLGNAATATALATGRTLGITGDLTWASPAFDGSANVAAAGTLATLLTAGSAGSASAVPVLTWDAKGRLTAVSTANIPATTPAGSNTQVQFNNAGAFGASSGLTYSATAGLYVANTATTAPQMTVRATASQTADIQQWQTSDGTVRGGVGVGAVKTGYDTHYLYLKPNSREYRVGTYEGNGAMIFARSDSSNSLFFIPSSTEVIVGASTGKLVLRGNQSSVVIAPTEGGGAAGYIELGQRYTDSSTGVGAHVRCWTNTGQTGNALSILAPGGGSTLAGFVASTGRLSFLTSDAAPVVPATPLIWLDVMVGGNTYKMPLYQ